MSSQFKPWLVLGVIFVAGILTGAALTISLAPHFMRPPGEMPMKRHWMTELVQRLNLTTDQQEKIEPIVTDATAKLQAIHRDEMGHGAQIFKTAHDQISALLTPEQKMELQKMESEREKRFSGHMRSWGPPREGPGGLPQAAPNGGIMPSPPGAPTNTVPPPPP